MRDLGSQVVIAGGDKLAAGSLAKASMPISGVPLMREAQLLAGVDPATFAAQPFLSDAITRMRRRRVGNEAIRETERRGITLRQRGNAQLTRAAKCNQEWEPTPSDVEAARWRLRSVLLTNFPKRMSRSGPDSVYDVSRA